MRYRDDVASAVVGLDNIQNLPNTRPKELGLGQVRQQRFARSHGRFRIFTRISNTSVQTPDFPRHVRVKERSDIRNLLQGENCSYVEWSLRSSQFLDQWER